MVFTTRRVVSFPRCFFRRPGLALGFPLLYLLFLLLLSSTKRYLFFPVLHPHFLHTPPKAADAPLSPPTSLYDDALAFSCHVLKKWPRSLPCHAFLGRATRLRPCLRRAGSVAEWSWGLHLCSRLRATPPCSRAMMIRRWTTIYMELAVKSGTLALGLTSSLRRRTRMTQPWETT
jgi:hypothetical protein